MRVLHIDAFTDRPFKGNPAAVVLLDRERDATWMQSVGAEMNLSETAFLLHRGDDWSLRWFTPTVEVDLCGHATLASAHALWSEQLLDPDETARFQTRSGLLTASLNGNLIELDFPITLEAPADPPAGLLEALGVKKPLYVGKNKFDYLVEVESEDAVPRRPIAEYRGADCTFWALFNGEPDQVGCTLHRIDNGIDTGTLIAHICPEVDEGDGELTLFWRAVRDSAEVYAEMLERLARGERVGEPQREWGRLYQVKDRTWRAERQLAARMRDGLLRGLHLPARVRWFGVPAPNSTATPPRARQPERER